MQPVTTPSAPRNWGTRCLPAARVDPRRRWWPLLLGALLVAGCSGGGRGPAGDTARDGGRDELDASDKEDGAAQDPKPRDAASPRDARSQDDTDGCDKPLCVSDCGGCPEGKVCRDGTCVCTPREEQLCEGGDLHWIDSCGAPGEVAEHCEHGCIDGACADGPMSCASEPCPDGYYCDLAEKICKSGCSSDSHCGDNEECNLADNTCECADNYHRCSGECVSDRDPDHCGGSCSPCRTPDDGTATCSGGACGFECDDGYYRCDGACMTKAEFCGLSCSEPTYGYACSSESDCCAGHSCVEGECRKDLGESCSEPEACEPRYACEGGECCEDELGEDCDDDGDCCGDALCGRYDSCRLPRGAECDSDYECIEYSICSRVEYDEPDKCCMRTGDDCDDAKDCCNADDSAYHGGLQRRCESNECCRTYMEFCDSDYDCCDGLECKDHVSYENKKCQ